MKNLILIIFFLMLCFAIMSLNSRMDELNQKFDEVLARQHRIESYRNQDLF